MFCNMSIVLIIHAKWYNNVSYKYKCEVHTYKIQISNVQDILIHNILRWIIKMFYIICFRTCGTNGGSRTGIPFMVHAEDKNSFLL